MFRVATGYGHLGYNTAVYESLPYLRTAYKAGGLGLRLSAKV